MSIGVKVDIDIQNIEKITSPSIVKRAKVAVANQMLLDMENYVPRSKGDLRASGHVVSSGRVSVVYNTVYARAQFYGSNGIATFKKYTTSGTDKRWDEKATENHMDTWTKTAKKGLGLK